MQTFTLEHERVGPWPGQAPPAPTPGEWLLYGAFQKSGVPPIAGWFLLGKIPLEWTIVLGVLGIF